MCLGGFCLQFENIPHRQTKAANQSSVDEVSSVHKLYLIISCNKLTVMKTFWYIWCKALGEKAHSDCDIANQVALVRTLIVLCYIITNTFIVAGIIRHW